MQFKHSHNVVDNLLFEEYRFSAEALGFYRIVYILFSIFIIGVPSWMSLSNLPDLLYNPPFYSIGILFSGFPNYYFFLFITISVFVLHFFILFGYKTKISSVLLTILLIVGQTFAYSLGKIGHGRMITVWIPLFMGLSGWGAAFSIDNKMQKHCSVLPKTRGWPVFMLVSMLAFGMFSAGLPKLLGGWLEVSSQAVYAHFLRGYYIIGRQEFIAPYVLSLSSKLFWESLDYFGVFFELFFLFVIIRKKYLQFYIVLAIIFHIVNLLLLNISFMSNLPIYILFVNFNRLLNIEKVGYYINKVMTMKVFVGILFVFCFINYIAQQPIELYKLISSDYDVFSLIIMLALLIVSILGISYEYKYLPSININSKNK